MSVNVKHTRAYIYYYTCTQRRSNVEHSVSPGADIFIIPFGVYHRFVCVCVYGHTYSKSMNQPGKVANPARG